MRILIIEDDDRIADFLSRGLLAEGHVCVHSKDGREGFILAEDSALELIILDLMLPGMHGHEICQELRVRGVETPVLMLTAMDSIDDVVCGLRLGADDYMTKPFHFDELLARIEVLSRRRADTRQVAEPVIIGDIAFDREAMSVSVGGEKIDLTVKELAILDLLMAHPGKLFSRERILSNVWGMGMDPMTNVVDVYIGKLRKKLARSHSQSIIETVRGMGYRLDP